ncbi:MAG: inositol monophosphatase family protein [Bullifex sp.]
MMDRYEFTKNLIKRAGGFLLSHKAERTRVFDKSANDYVTQADRECESLITSAIRKAYPADGFYCEESGEENGSSGYTWVIDPIDGTVNYMNTFPLYTISVALCMGAEAVMGCVYVPEYDELFSAAKGKGAFLNGEMIHVSEEPDMKHSLALCVPPHRMHEQLPYYMERYDRVLRAVSDIRSIGSAALSLCYVASGRCSIYYELGLHAYDFAAGALILKEAGGCFRYERRGEVMYDIKASCPQFHERLLEMTR